MASIVGLRTGYQGWCRLLVADVLLADGTRFTREIEHHGDAVAVLPYDPERRTAFLVRQLRAPVLHAAGIAGLLEAPAGIADHGSVEQSVRAEALEEIGLQLREIEHIVTVWTMPGISTERTHLFLASVRPEDRRGTGGGLASEHEQIEVVELPLLELATGTPGLDVDLTTLTLTLLLRQRRPDLFREDG